MKTHLLLKIIPVLLMVAALASCTSPQEQSDGHSLTAGQLADSLLYFRQNGLQTDILSRHYSELSREQAYDIQLAMLDKELAGGATLVGWKMGGTATSDSSAFDPVFGYILDRNLIDPDSVVNTQDFPGGAAMVEGEVGFVLKNSLKEGVASKEELMGHIDYVIGAVEFAKTIAISSEGASTPGLNYVIATGMGQAGTIKGPVRAQARDFDFEKETARCYINDTLAAEGQATNIFGTPLNALYELANLLPTKNRYLRAGDLVITGSLYKNPTIEGPADVRLEFSTLGNISFTAQ